MAVKTERERERPELYGIQYYVTNLTHSYNHLLYFISVTYLSLCSKWNGISHAWLPCQHCNCCMPECPPVLITLTLTQQRNERWPPLQNRIIIFVLMGLPQADGHVIRKPQVNGRHAEAACRTGRRTRCGKNTTGINCHFSGGQGRPAASSVFTSTACTAHGTMDVSRSKVQHVSR